METQVRPINGVWKAVTTGETFTKEGKFFYDSQHRRWALTKGRTGLSMATRVETDGVTIKLVSDNPIVEVVLVVGVLLIAYLVLVRSRK